MKESKMRAALLVAPWVLGGVFALFNWGYPGRWLGGLVTILALNAAVLWSMRKTQEDPTIVSV